MNFKIYFYSLLLILLAFSINQIFFKDTHIRWQYKAFHYVHHFTGWLYGLKGNFDRNIFNYMKKILYCERECFTPEIDNGILIKDIEIESKSVHKGKFIIRVYIPIGTEEKKYPVLIHIHGGGFALDLGEDRNPSLAKEGMVVVSILYRLAPENKFPIPYEDCYSALLWLNETNEELITKYANLDKISLLGDSAGGNLVAVLTHLARDRKYPRKLSHQILIYPWMMTKEITESRKRLNNTAYLIDYELSEWFKTMYLENENDDNNSLVNPLLNTDFTNIPSCLLILATEDVLYSEGKAYGELLNKHNILVEYEEYVTVHGFYNLFDLQKEDAEAIKRIIQFLKSQNFI